MSEKDSENDSKATKIYDSNGTEIYELVEEILGTISLQEKQDTVEHPTKNGQ